MPPPTTLTVEQLIDLDARAEQVGALASTAGELLSQTPDGADYGASGMIDGDEAWLHVRRRSLDIRETTRNVQDGYRGRPYEDTVSLLTDLRGQAMELLELAQRTLTLMGGEEPPRPFTDPARRHALLAATHARLEDAASQLPAIVADQADIAGELRPLIDARDDQDDLARDATVALRRYANSVDALASATIRGLAETRAAIDIDDALASLRRAGHPHAPHLQAAADRDFDGVDDRVFRLTGSDSQNRPGPYAKPGQPHGALEETLALKAECEEMLRQLRARDAEHNDRDA